MKIKFNLDDQLPLNKAIEIPTITIVARAMFLKITNIIHKLSQMNVCIKYKKQILKNELKEIDIKNRACYYFDYITNGTDINFSDIFIRLKII